MTGLEDEVQPTIDKISAAIHNHTSMHFSLDGARVACIFHDLIRKHGNIDNLGIIRIINGLPSESESNKETIQDIYHTISLLGHCHEVL